MSNPKPPLPRLNQCPNGWVHKCDADDYLDRHLPIPTQVVSNEEYYPLPQTPEQKAVEHHLLEIATGNSKKAGDRSERLPAVSLRHGCSVHRVEPSLWPLF